MGSLGKLKKVRKQVPERNTAPRTPSFNLESSILDFSPEESLEESMLF